MTLMDDLESQLALAQTKVYEIQNRLSTPVDLGLCTLIDSLLYAAMRANEILMEHLKHEDQIEA